MQKQEKTGGVPETCFVSFDLVIRPLPHRRATGFC